jgi:hypothetical protein
LLRLEEVLSRLQELQREGVDPRGDFRQAWLAERGLQLAAEIALDIGNHILSAHFGVSARDYEDVLTQLAACGVIDSALRERFRGLLADARSSRGLEPVHGRILAEDVVANFGARHRLAHGGRRARHGVAAEVDRSHRAGSRRRRAPRQASATAAVSDAAVEGSGAGTIVYEIATSAAIDMS